MNFEKGFGSWKKKIILHKKHLIYAVCFLLIAVILDLSASHYVIQTETTEVNDLILDHIPPIDLNFIFVYSWIIVCFLLLVYPLFWNPSKLHQSIFHFSLLTIVRSAFITLTHLKTPVEAIPARFPWPFSFMAFENDMFFSGHTAMPLIGFFLFKGEKIRWLFLAFSIISGATALIMHRHYSIDVFAAFFIAYGTFKVGEWIQKKLKF